MEKLVSVIVPVYKVEEYIARCVESILAQTYQNMQIILVDDGSPDNSIPICQEYAKSDNRIEIVRQENQGVSVARNNGIDHATGEYICFVDSDDYIMPNYVSRLVESIESDGGRTACIADIIWDMTMGLEWKAAKRTFQTSY